MAAPKAPREGVILPFRRREADQAPRQEPAANEAPGVHFGAGDDFCALATGPPQHFKYGPPCIDIKVTARIDACRGQ